MKDVEIAEYYFPHCMMHWPEQAKDFAEEARLLLKTKSGKRTLNQLRLEYEESCSTEREFIQKIQLWEGKINNE